MLYSWEGVEPGTYHFGNTQKRHRLLYRSKAEGGIRVASKLAASSLPFNTVQRRRIAGNFTAGSSQTIPPINNQIPLEQHNHNGADQYLMTGATYE